MGVISQACMMCRLGAGNTLMWFLLVVIVAAKLCPTHDPLDCSPSGSSVHGILQVRILGWVAIPFSWGSSQPRSPALQADSLPSEGPKTPLYIYACTFIYMYIRHIYLYAYTCVGQVCIYVSVCLYACMYVCVYTHAWMHTSMLYIHLSLPGSSNSRSTQPTVHTNEIKMITT